MSAANDSLKIVQSGDAFIITTVSDDTKIYFEQSAMCAIKQLTKHKIVKAENLGSFMYVNLHDLTFYKECYDSLEEASNTIRFMEAQLKVLLVMANFETACETYRMQIIAALVSKNKQAELENELVVLQEQIDALDKKEQILQEQTA